MAKRKPTLKRPEVITEARERFEYAKEAWAQIYETCRADLKFSNPTDPQQWPEAVKRERQLSEGGARPCMTFDQTSQYVRQVVNQARRNKPAIKYLPVDSESDPRLAEKLQGLARQTEHQSRADVAYIQALDHATRGGLGFFMLRVEEVQNSEIRGQLQSKICRVPDFETVLLDPDFTQPDGSDAEYGFVEDLIPRKRFEKLYPKAAAVDFDQSGWFSDKHVRVCEYYKVEDTTEPGEPVIDEASGMPLIDAATGKPLLGDGKKTRIVRHYKISGEEVLEETTFPGEFVPIFPVLGNEEWENGKRKLGGCIRTARDAQVTYNFERNAEYEAVALGPKAPWLVAAEAMEGYEAFWKQANRGNLAALPWNHVDEQGNPIPAPQRIQPAGIASGWTQLSERSRNDIQAAMGMFQASVGQPNSQSGRAVLALQDKAEVGSFHYVDNLALSISHCGRVLTQVWPVIYDQAQMVRILGEDDKPEFVQVDPSLQVGYAEAKTPQGKQIIINPSVGRYDVRVTTGPAYQTRQTEAAAEIGEIVNGNPQLMAILGDVWVKMRNFPEAEKIAKRLRAMLPPQIQQAEAQEENAEIPPHVQAAMQQMQAQMQQMQQALQEAQSGMAEKQLEIQSRTQLQAMKDEAAMMREQMKADAAYDRQELADLMAFVRERLAPPPQLADAVSEDMQEAPGSYS